MKARECGMTSDILTFGPLLDGHCKKKKKKKAPLSDCGCFGKLETGLGLVERSTLVYLESDDCTGTASSTP